MIGGKKAGGQGLAPGQGSDAQRMGQIEHLKKTNFQLLTKERHAAAGLSTDILIRAGAGEFQFERLFEGGVIEEGYGLWLILYWWCLVSCGVLH